ncbi:MAG: c-type cytochrome [Ignavibacteriaceae bacterium]|nr:c-type cytochrome [Ignavibacteriaceae bacterium]HRQ53841.1 c-type cytochrome [Ignavibacteriaceae bacterium]
MSSIIKSQSKERRIMQEERKKNSVVKYLSLFFIIASIGLMSCGDNGSQDAAKNNDTKKTGQGDISAFELENGFGPIKQKIELAPIDPKLVARGKEIFDTKCSACHKLDEKYVGPAQRDITKRRTPEFIINFMLNPEENYKKHPEAKKLLAEYMTTMPNQNLTIDDAKAILDYFRQAVNEK